MLNLVQLSRSAGGQASFSRLAVRIAVASLYSICLGVGPAIYAAEDDPDGVIERLRKRAAEIRSEVLTLDCKCRMLSYSGPEHYVQNGGHLLTRAAAQQFIQSACESWVNHRDPDQVYRLSEDIGVPPVQLEQIWCKTHILWETGRIRNTRVPYSKTHGTGIDCAFDGRAEWLHMMQSGQVTVYDRTPKLGYFDIASIRRTVSFRGDWKLVAMTDETVSLTSPPQWGERDYRFDRESGQILSVREGEHGIDEYFAAGVGPLDPSQSRITFPLCAANVHYKGDDVATLDLYLIEECVLNREFTDADFAMSVPANTRVFYAGDMQPGEDAVNHTMLSQARVRTATEDVRPLLPELRRQWDFKHQTRPALQRTSQLMSPRGLMILGVNVGAVILFATLWFLRSRFRPGGFRAP